MFTDYNTTDENINIFNILFGQENTFWENRVSDNRSLSLDVQKNGRNRKTRYETAGTEPVVSCRIRCLRETFDVIRMDRVGAKRLGTEWEQRG